MVKNSIRVPAFLILLLVAVSCKKGNNDNLMPPVSGKAGEVVLVMPDNLYKGSLGDSIASVLTKEELALPQTGMQGAEPIFDLVHIPPAAFTNIFRTHRNIIIAQLNAELQKPVIKVEKNYWAFQQVLIRIEAPDKESFAQVLYENEDYLVETIREAEIERQVYLNKKFENSELHRSLLAKHNIIAYFPKGYEARVDTGNFVWIQHNPTDMIQGVLIWDYPYTDEDQLTYPNLVAKNDEMLKSRVPGEAKGSYMTIYFGAPTYSKTLEHNGHFVREIKGLWELEGDWMGGPFVSWTYVDEKRSRLVTLFGFVYAPKYEKRNHIRKVESLLRTIDFPD